MTLEPAGTVVARKQLSRRKLLDAARQLFIEHGYHDTRPQDIARAAGVGHGTFYLHFADKRECYLAFVDEAADELNKKVIAYTANADTIEDVIRGIFNACRAYANERPGVLTAALVDAEVIGCGGEVPAPCLSDRWAHDWTDRLLALSEQKKIATDLDPYVIGHAIFGALHSAFSGCQRDGISPEDMTENVIPFIARGLGAAPPTKN